MQFLRMLVHMRVFVCVLSAGRPTGVLTNPLPRPPPHPSPRDGSPLPFPLSSPPPRRVSLPLSVPPFIVNLF